MVRIIESLENADVPYLQKIPPVTWFEMLSQRRHPPAQLKEKSPVDVLHSFVLGPSLWDVGLDRILRLKLTQGVQLICYVDDNFIADCAETVYQGG